MAPEVSNVRPIGYSTETIKASATKTTSAPNSIMVDASKTTSVPQEQEKTESAKSQLDKIYEQLAKELAKYNITVEDLKKNKVLERVSGVNAESLENSLKAESDFAKRLIQCVKQAYADTEVDGKVDIDKAILKGNTYVVALATGWKSIDEYKSKEKVYGEKTLVETLIEKGYLKEGETSKEDIKKAVIVLIEKAVAKAKQEQNNKNSVDEAKEQLKILGVLFNNSSIEEKGLFFDVLKDLKAENKLTGLDVLFKSCTTPEERQKLANNISNEQIRAFIENVDKDDATGITKIVTSTQSEDVVTVNAESDNKFRQEWLNDNKEALDKIQEKIKKAEENGESPKLTEDEVKILKDYENLIIAVSTGRVLGVADGDFSEDFKNVFLLKQNKEAYNLSEDVYKDMLSNAVEYVKANKDKFVNITPDKLEHLLNNTTNGNYSKIESGDSSKLTPPTERHSSQDNSSEVGFAKSNVTDETFSNLEKLRQAIKNQNREEKPSFEIEKEPEADVSKPVEAKSIDMEIRQARSNKQKIDIIKKYIDLSTKIKLGLDNYINRSSNKLFALNMLPSNIRFKYAKDFVKSGIFKEDDIAKLNLTHSWRQDLQKTLEEVQKEKQSV